ncbi:MAG: xanthine dehydrogenase family protein molybdopterin-binding subunit [Geminicoccaceae bacterium]|nr:xanthine dehydrogenase family protein molybdopterin-binding subunit [Geminicoccaceae bacterium]
MSKFGVGQPIRRVEDIRLVTGHGRYTDDISMPGQAHGFVLRSPVAHARIRSIDTSTALAQPGVLGIYTGQDLDAQVPCLIENNPKTGVARNDAPHPVLCRDKVCYVGDNIAFVVAETLAQARDAAELIEVDFDELPAVVNTHDAADSGQPQVHDSAPGNVAFNWHIGNKDETDAAFSSASHVTKVELINNRLICNAMEPRAAVAEFDAKSGKLTVHTCTQGGWAFKDALADNLGMESENVRVLTPDVGGGFGMKAMFYAEYTMAAYAAKRLGRAVRWTAERSEGFLSDTMGRDHVTVAELAFDANKRITGMRVHTTANMGAYYYFFAPFIPTGAAAKVLPGVYDIPKISYTVLGVFTNTVPVDAYRGAGRPESIYCVERLIDKAAREMGMDPSELRRINFIKPDQMPYRTSVGEVYDSGEFARVMDACMEKSGYGSLSQRRSEAEARGKKRGIGMCYYIESTMGDPSETAKVEFGADGTVSVLVGTQSNGQGHETAYAQVLHSRLHVPFENIRIVQGDTDRIRGGGGTGGSRSLTAQGMAINDASDVIIERGKAFAAQHFEAATADIQFHEGTFSVAGTDRRIDIMELADKARSMVVEGMEGDGLDAEATTVLDAWTFPNGCHIAEVEIDPVTGTTEVVNYQIVDDFGTIVNPLLVEGQVHGGVVQGIGQALMEHVVYDASGQLLSGSFMDYTMPRADILPSFKFSTIEVPCKNNAMGVKGCGEAGSVGSCAAIINAVVDALGVEHVDMPATPQKVWQIVSKAA